MRERSTDANYAATRDERACEELARRHSLPVECIRNAFKIAEAMVSKATRGPLGAATASDLAMAAYTGVLEALETFDAGRGVKLETHVYNRAWFAMRHEVSNYDHLGRYHRQRANRCIKEHRTREEAAEANGETFAETLPAWVEFAPVSLTAIEQEDEDEFHLESARALVMVGSQAAMPVEEEVVSRVGGEQLRALLDRAFNRLTEEEADVMRCRYWERLTLRQTGERVCRSPEHVRQQQQHAERRLREMFGSPPGEEGG